MLAYERRAKRDGFRIIVGVDEAGRGPLAGPVVVAAVVLKQCRFSCRIDDSKKLTARARLKAFGEIASKGYFGVGVMNERVVDSLNVSVATSFAAETAVRRLLDILKVPRPTLKNTILLLDGRLSCGLPYRSREIIGGDGLSLSIAAASIVAKVVRDRMMLIYDRVYPEYAFGDHKGYGTRLHMERIAAHGLSPIHRDSFCSAPSPP